MRNLLGTPLYTLKENNTIVKLFKIRSESGSNFPYSMLPLKISLSHTMPILSVCILILNTNVSQKQTSLEANLI